MIRSLLDRYRQPAYTGSNRCLPCTVTNAAIGIVVGNAAFAVCLALGRSPVVAAVVGVSVIAIAGVQIWLRGYLVPGTPTFTRRYVPPWLLRAYGKDPFIIDVGGVDDRSAVVDHLLEARAVQFDDDADLELDPGFADAWRTAVEELGTLPPAVTDVFAVDGELVIDESDRRVAVFLDDRPLGRWESRAALLADLGAGRVLADRDEDWAGLSTAQRGRLVAGLRRHIDFCPACAGEPAVATETTTSCCREYEVAIVSCADCGVRLSELPVGSPSRPSVTITPDLSRTS